MRALPLLLLLPSPSCSYTLRQPYHIPSAITFHPDLPLSRITMCAIDWGAYAASPAVFPMFEDLQASNECGKQGYVTTLAALQSEYIARGCSATSSAGYGGLTLGCAPAGVLFHESRCGSTLVANMIAATPGMIMYSESGPVAAILRVGNMTSTARVHWLRVIVAAMGRPIYSALHDLNAGDLNHATRAPPRYLYIKTQHQVALSLHIYRSAFPAMPWLYIHRTPVEVLMSLFQTADTAPTSTAGEADFISIPAASREDYYRNNPCLRTRAEAPDFILAMTDAAQALGARVVSPVEGYSGSPGKRSQRVERVSFEDWCAADLAYVTSAALESAIAARRDVIEQLALAGMPVAERGSVAARARVVQAEWDRVDVTDGAAFAAAVVRLDAGRGCVHARDGMVLDAKTDTGTVMGVGLGMFVDYSDLPDIVPLLLDTHLRPSVRGFRTATVDEAPHTYRGGEDSTCAAIEAPPAALLKRPALLRLLATADEHRWNLTAEALDAQMTVSSMYSKARATASQLHGLKHAPGGIRPFRVAGGGRLRAARPWRNIGEDGRYVNDAAVKQARVWPSMRAAADRFLSPLRRSMLAFNVPFTAEERTAMESYMLKEKEDAATAMAAYEAEVWSAIPDVARRLITAGADTQEAASVAAFGHAVHAAVVAAGEAPSVRESSQLPLGRGYPATFSLTHILQDWHPGIITPPATYGRYSSLRTFDYLRELTDAHEYRRQEVPFVVRNVPSLNRLVDWWADDDYLIDLLGRDRTYGAEVSDSARFLYYSKSVVKRMRAKGGTFTPPTRHVNMKMSAWLQRAYSVGKAVTEEEEDQLPSWWTKGEGDSPVEYAVLAEGRDVVNTSVQLVPLDLLRAAGKSKGVASVTLPQWSTQTAAAYGLPSRRPRVSAPTRRKRSLTYLWAGTEPPPGQPATNEWIHTSFRGMFSPGDALFVENGDAQKGIMCRFGMPGIISEAHWDAGRNFIAVVRGFKRYILLPPDQCKHLNLTLTGPSARQSELDFTDADTIAKLRHVRAIEVILEPGDVLYVPALWMHYIVSLTINAQCNTRSGTPPVALEEMTACGFDMSDVPVEAAGVYASRSAKRSGQAQEPRMPPLNAAVFERIELMHAAAASPSPSHHGAGVAAAPTPLEESRRLPVADMVSFIARERVEDELGVFSSLKQVAYARSNQACSSDAYVYDANTPSLLTKLSCMPTYIERRARAVVGASLPAAASAWMSSLQCILIAAVALATLQYALRRYTRWAAGATDGTGPKRRPGGFGHALRSHVA